MKRFLFGFLAALFLILNTIPFLHILADDMPTSSQYEMLGAYALSTLITSGEATELDFSDYTESDTSFLINLGEAIFTGDWSGLAEDGLEWLGETADSIYDSYKEYVSQWKSDHLGIMYSNWFPDETIYVGPDDSYSLAKPLRELLTPRDNSNSVPQPDPDFSFISNINYLYQGGFEWLQTDYPIWSGYQGCYFVIPRNSVTLISPDFISKNAHTYGGTDSSKTYAIYPCNGLVTISLYTQSDNTINAIYSSYDIFSNGGSYFAEAPTETSGPVPLRVYWNSHIYMKYGSDQTLNALPTQNSFVGISTAINYIYQHYANINLYVDGVPWVLVSVGPTYPIVIPGQLTIYNDQPLEYSFPANTHIELTDLTTIIRNAINSSGVVMWSDIADTYVDVNGQTAVAVTEIVRNDYDNLYMEQYPYPAMLVGMTDQTKFNEHLLDNSHAYLSPIGTVVQETVNVLPSELVGVLAIGAILTIFAVIINRLLE